MKKLLITLLVLGLFMTLGFAQSALAVEIEYWNLFTGGDGQFMDEMVEQFNEEHPDIQVNSTTLEWSEYYTGLITGVAAGEGPHVAISHTSRLSDLVNQGIVSPVDPFVEAAELDWDQYDQNLLGETIFNDEHYAVPLDSHFNVFWYHEDYFAEAGLLAEDGSLDIGGSPEEFMDALEQVVANSEAEHGVTYANSLPHFDLNRSWWGFYNQMGEEVTVEGTQVNMDVEKSAEILELFLALRERGIVPRTNYDEAINLFTGGDSAAVITGVWVAGMFSEIEGIKAAQMPTLFEQPASWGDSHSFVIPYNPDASQEEQEAALKFAKYLSEMGLHWAEAGHVPAVESVRATEEFNKMPFRDVLNEAVVNVAYDNIGEKTWVLRDILTEEIANMLNDDNLTPADSARRIKQMLEAEL